MNPSEERRLLLTRRQFVGRGATGIGGLALASLLNEHLLGGESASPTAAREPHFPPTAKRAIYLHMSGAPSQLDLFDNKPELVRLNGKLCPESLMKNQRFAFLSGPVRMLASPYKFHSRGSGGMEFSELLPHLGAVADEICLVRSLHTDQFNHAPAQLFVHTGASRQGRPSLGSWLGYGLGSEGQDLPAFVVLTSGNNAPDGGASLWGSGFLPTVYQGVHCRSKGEPVLYVNNPPGIDREGRRRGLDALNDLNRIQSAEIGDPETLTRIAQYELAFRMQASVPELMDISREPKTIRDLYGIEGNDDSFARNCLLARRLLERGTRFVQLFHAGWDNHGEVSGNDLLSGLSRQCRQTDQASAALIIDLKQRGMLDDTLVIWGGEFGRTPMLENRAEAGRLLGRDHHPHCFSVWLAGGGVKSGFIYGQTDELGYHVARDPVHIHDLQATILHCFGLDHTRLTHRFQGRDYRLTDVYGNVVRGILA